MRKASFVFGFLVFLVLGPFVVPSPVLAGRNITGVNLGGTWDVQIVRETAQIVGPGGWVVLIATPGDCGKLQEILDANLGVNIIIRPWKGNVPFTEADARGWVATLGHLKTSQKIYFIPWNEPNGPHLEVAPSVVKSYTNTLANYLAAAGLRPGRVALLSPMINQYQAGLKSYLDGLGGGSFFRQFDGISMNLYDNQSCGSPLCASDFHQNASRFGEVLEEMGTSGMPVFAVETGVVVGAPRYRDLELKNFFEAVYPHWEKASNFVMSSVFSYDPEYEDPWNIFGSETAQFLKAHHGSGPIGQGAINQVAFDQWFAGVKDTLVACGACGYAPSQDLCQGISSGVIFPRIFKSSRSVLTTDVTPSIGDPITFSQEGSLPLFGSQKEIVRAGFFESFKDLSLPFARQLTEYLAGPFVFQGNTAINNFLGFPRLEKAGVLVKLTPFDLQDKMRRDYWKKCKDGTYCSTLNISHDNPNCPSPESNECLIADGTEIGNLAPPPDPKTEAYKTNPNQYLKGLDSWQRIWGYRWAQIPLFSNPKTQVDNAIKMVSCGAEDGTNVTTKTPWVSPLKEVAEFLADLLLGEGGSPVSAKPNVPLTESSGSKSTSVLGETTQLARAVAPLTSACGPPEAPPFKPDGEKDSIEVSGQALVVGPGTILRCEAWGLDPIRGFYCVKGNSSATIDNPVWPVVDYPFLNTIYEKLAGSTGIFQAIFKPASTETKDWDFAGESDLNYCLSPVQMYASIDPRWNAPKFLGGGGLYPYKVNFKPKAVCQFSSPPFTQNLRIYPEKIGGVKNAQEWAIKELNP